MKKLALTIASVAAIVTFAPEASALPVFARQVGMACNACHFQHYPLLNSFGRAFKANGFVMMGAQPLVEGDGLSIPDRLNFAALTSVYYSSQSGDNKSPQVGVPASGGELSLFYGGRVSENAGFLSELGVGGAAATGGAKLILLYPVGDNRVGTAFFSSGQGAGYGLEYLNTGAVDAHKMMNNTGLQEQHGGAAYAGRYMGSISDATGASIVADGSWGFANVGVFAAAPTGTNARAQDLSLTYARLVGTFDLAGWDSAVGIQSFGGASCVADVAAVPSVIPGTAGAPGAAGDPITLGSALVPGACTDHALTIVDAQFQGEISGMSTGFYVEYGVAPANSNGNANAFAAANSSVLIAAANANAASAGSIKGSSANLKATTLNLSTTVEVTPGATIQLAARFAQLSDSSSGANAGANADIAGNDNALMIGATYQLAQNLNMGANYTVASGSAWDSFKTKTGVDAVGKTAGTIYLYALF
jgi:hypothetical protein